MVEEANKVLGRDGWSSNVTSFEKDFVRPLDPICHVEINIFIILTFSWFL